MTRCVSCNKSFKAVGKRVCWITKSMCGSCYRRDFSKRTEIALVRY